MSRRIALVSSSYHPHVGGVEAHVRNLASQLVAGGHQVVVWTVDRGDHLGVQELDGVEIRYLPTPLPARNPGDITRFTAQFPRAWRHWVKAHRDFHPDLLHVHCFGPNGLYALALHRRFSTPLIVTSHGETFADDYGVFDESALLRWGLRTSLGRAAATTAPAVMACSDLKARFGARSCEVVPNGVDLEELPTAGLTDRLPADWPNDARVVVTVGRVEHVKGFDLLLRAFAAVAKPGDHLVIAGDGSQRASLERLATDLGVRESVLFTGYLDRPTVAATLRAADVVVVSSRLDTFPTVTLEAWRAGAPLVLTTRSGAADVVIDGETGLLVDPEDTAALGAAIRAVLDDPSRAEKLAAGGREAVLAFTWERVARAYESVYDRVLAT